MFIYIGLVDATVPFQCIAAGSGDVFHLVSFLYGVRRFSRTYVYHKVLCLHVSTLTGAAVSQLYRVVT